MGSCLIRFFFTKLMGAAPSVTVVFKMSSDMMILLVSQSDIYVVKNDVGRL